MFSSKRIIILGSLAILGHGLGIVADIASGYAPGVDIVVISIASLSLADVAPLLQSKPLHEVVIGHYLAIFFIPFGLFGIWQVYQAMNPQGNQLATPFMLVGVFGLIYATFYHGTLGFLAGALQAGNELADAGTIGADIWREMILFFNSLSEPLGIVLLLVDLSASLLFVANVWIRDTQFPRWMAGVNPLSIQLLISVLIWLVAHPLKQLLWLTVFNLSLALWYITTTVVLWRWQTTRNQHP